MSVCVLCRVMNRDVLMFYANPEKTSFGTCPAQGKCLPLLLLLLLLVLSRAFKVTLLPRDVECLMQSQGRLDSAQ